jgi:hypothetical protein
MKKTKTILLTIDYPQFDDRNYIVCKTKYSEPELKTIIEEIMQNEVIMFASVITDILTERKIIKEVGTGKIDQYWVEI